ncbi:hypothetical protein C8J57DRAFT_1564676, partial [Mycena rebaudengoi]
SSFTHFCATVPSAHQDHKQVRAAPLERSPTRRAPGVCGRRMRHARGTTRPCSVGRCHLAPTCDPPRAPTTGHPSGMDGGFLAAWDGSILAACGSRLCSSTSPTHGRPLICLNFAPLPTDSLTSACPARLPLAARWYRGCGLGDSPSPAWTRQRARPSSWDRGIPAAFAH